MNDTTLLVNNKFGGFFVSITGTFSVDILEGVADTVDCIIDVTGEVKVGVDNENELLLSKASLASLIFNRIL